MNSNRSNRFSRINGKPLQRQRKNSRGIVLVSVLWLLFLLCALAAAASFTVRTQATIVHVNAESAREAAALDAAIVQTIARLSDEIPSRRPAIDAEQYLSFGDISVGVAISSEDGRIDLNFVSDDLLTSYLRARNVGQLDAQGLVDELRSHRGANPPGGNLAGSVLSTSTEPLLLKERVLLKSVDGLNQLPRWSNVPLGCWHDDLTVFTQNMSASIDDAPPFVSIALKSQRAHSNEAETSTEALAALASVPRAPRSFAGHVLRISARATLSGHAGIRRDWIGRVTGDSKYPALTMFWSDVINSSQSACDKSGVR